MFRSETCAVNLLDALLISSKKCRFKAFFNLFERYLQKQKAVIQNERTAAHRRTHGYNIYIFKSHTELQIHHYGIKTEEV